MMDKKLRIFRFLPEKDKKPRYQDYTVHLEKEGMMVLDGLNQVRWEQDGTLSYRRSCREGVCGSDGLNINGVNQLACITPLKDLKEPVVIRPLPGLSVIKDLVVDLKHFLKQYRLIKPYLQTVTPEPVHEWHQSPEDRKKLDGLYECILCACCVTSCPSYWWNQERFLGPAVLLQAYRWIVDSRDEETGKRLDDLDDPFRLFRCHTIMNCAECCPKGLNPTKAINEIRRLLATREI